MGISLTFRRAAVACRILMRWAVFSLAAAAVTIQLCRSYRRPGDHVERHYRVGRAVIPEIHGGIFRDRPDWPMTDSLPPEPSLASPPSFDIALARRYLRQRQAYWASLVGAPGLDDPVARTLHVLCGAKYRPFGMDPSFA